MNIAPQNQLRRFKKPYNASPLDESFSKWRENHSELFIDLGCGVGYHPIQLAKLYPEAGIIAIERTRNKFLSMQRRVQQHSLRNIFAVYEDAMTWVPNNLKEKSIDKAFFLYPNPYPKKKQANKRWHRQPFLSSILAKVKVGGSLTFATNEKWLHEESEDYMLNHWKLKLLSNSTLSPRTEGPFRTHFEKKYLLRGESCFNLEFIKE